MLKKEGWTREVEVTNIQVCCPSNMYMVILVVHFALVILKHKKCKILCYEGRIDIICNVFLLHESGSMCPDEKTEDKIIGLIVTQASVVCLTLSYAERKCEHVEQIQ